jgi:hypothetical protein
MRGLLRLAIPALLASSPAFGQQDQLPGTVRRTLTARYPGWRFAELDPHLAHELAAGQSPAWVQADFDGDGRQDYAVQLIAPSAARDSAQQVVALITRGGRLEPIVLLSGGLRNGIYLGREARGTMVIDLQQYDDDSDPGPTNGGVVLKNDGVTIYYGQEAASTCFYKPPEFRCVVSGD